MGPILMSLSGALLLIVAYNIGSIIREDRRLRHIKGPTSARFSKWWLIRSMMSGRQYLDLYETNEKYGALLESPLCSRFHALAK